MPREHPRLLGSRERLQQLARERADSYQRVVRVARSEDADEWSKLVSMALVGAIDRDADLGRRAVQRAMKTVTGPIRTGHETFGHDLARCAMVYDLCHEHWTAEQQSPTPFRGPFGRIYGRNPAADPRRVFGGRIGTPTRVATSDKCRSYGGCFFCGRIWP